MTGFGCKLFTALSRWNSLSSLIEKLLRIYGICGKIIVILVEHWAGGDIDSLVEAQMFHIAVCSCKTGSLEQHIFGLLRIVVELRAAGGDELQPEGGRCLRRQTCKM